MTARRLDLAAIVLAALTGGRVSSARAAMGASVIGPPDPGEQLAISAGLGVADAGGRRMHEPDRDDAPHILDPAPGERRGLPRRAR